MQPEDLPSKAVLQRLGFRLEGFPPRYLKIGPLARATNAGRS